MTLDFIRDINPYEEHAVRLSNFNSAQAGKFKQVVDDFIKNPTMVLDIADLDFIEAIDCRLRFRMADEDFGIQTNNVVQFYCDLTMESFKRMSVLLEPFTRKESKGFEWLYDVDTPIGLLFSAGEK
ncbi:MAG: hypothetical protein H7259_07700 [Cytophagales bacterium]|nr:hypothetical protein [Cytophaga sp.]